MHPIKRYRMVKGLTQTDLAKQVGVSPASVQFWETGSGPRPKSFRKVCEVLDIDSLQLINEIETWSKEEGTRKQ